MIVHRRPFTPAGRIAAWVLAAVCLCAGGVSLALGLSRRLVVLALAGAGGLAFGVLYARAAWAGRGLRWPGR